MKIPVDHLVGMPILSKYFVAKGLEDVVIVSPDHGKRNQSQKHGTASECTDRHRG